MRKKRKPKVDVMQIPDPIYSESVRLFGLSLVYDPEPMLE